MSETEQLLDIAFGAPDAPADDATPAADETATSPGESLNDDQDAVEEISIDEALAELAGETAPESDEAAAADADVEAETTPDELAELRRFREEVLAEKALEAAAQDDAAFDARYYRQQAINDNFFEAEVARIEQIGEEQGRSQAEIKAAIYDRVELGNGFGIEEWNPQTGRMEVYGRIEAEQRLLRHYNTAARERERSKTQPSAFEQLVQHYQLDGEDRTALAKFINYPPEHLEEIAKTLGAKNQRLTTTQANARQDAISNVKTRLSQHTAPGIPGAAPKTRQLKAPTNKAQERQWTEYVTQRLGLLGPTG